MSISICMWITGRLEQKTLCTRADLRINFLHNKSIWNLHKNWLLYDFFSLFSNHPRTQCGRKFLAYSILLFLVWQKFSASITSHIKFKFWDGLLLTNVSTIRPKLKGRLRPSFNKEPLQNAAFSQWNLPQRDWSTGLSRWNNKKRDRNSLSKYQDLSSITSIPLIPWNYFGSIYE